MTKRTHLRDNKKGSLYNKYRKKKKSNFLKTENEEIRKKKYGSETNGLGKIYFACAATNWGVLMRQIPQSGSLGFVFSFFLFTGWLSGR